MQTITTSQSESEGKTAENDQMTERDWAIWFVLTYKRYLPPAVQGDVMSYVQRQENAKWRHYHNDLQR